MHRHNMKKLSEYETKKKLFGRKKPRKMTSDAEKEQGETPEYSLNDSEL